MGKISCLVLNTTKLKKENIFNLSQAEIYNSTTLTMCCRMISFRGGISLSFTQIGPKVQRVTNMNFVLTISKHLQEKRLGEVIK